MHSVLVVDDAQFMRTTTSNMFLEWGFNVVGNASNGEEAVKLYREYEPDIVTMDVTMPVKSGIEASKEILSEYPDANIIMITALGQQRLIMEALEIGVKDFIAKPVNASQLKIIVNKVLNTYD
ncbi:MAG: response regulator [Lysinibacillus sp.]|nr:response regulator [Lysinibacillus sp.]